MSARLIKNGEPSAFAPYALPSTEGVTLARGASAAPAAFHFPVTPSTASSHTTSPSPNATESHEGVSEEGRISIDEARLEAERIIAQAEARAGEIEREACERGLAEARARVAEEVAQAVEPMREQLTHTLAEMGELNEAMTVRLERDVVRLAIEIARKVTQREVMIDPEIALTLTRVALSRLHNQTAATVHLHPEDYAYVAAHRDSLEAGGAIEIVEDRSISRGGCLVRTAMGDVDARIEQQFAEVERGFLSA